MVITPHGPDDSSSRRSAALREHLFISYAWEDGALAEWLTLKLTAAGYRVWCDRFKILGGERWPSDIDDAIRHHAFVVLHLLSAHSLRKENPSKERELALQLAGKGGVIRDFLIPLNVDGTRPEQLPWRIVDIAFIPFQSWSAGLSRLVEKLESLEAPRPLSVSGRSIAGSALLRGNAVVAEAEHLYSNCLRFKVIPEVIRRFDFSRPVHRSDLVAMERRWAFRQSGDRTALAFHRPKEELVPHLGIREEAGGSLWRSNVKVDGINSGNLIAELLRKEVEVALATRGLVATPDGRRQFFPKGLLAGDRLPFVSYRERAISIKAGGSRRYASGTFDYRLAIGCFVRRDVAEGYALLVRLGVVLLDAEGKLIEDATASKRRKRVTSGWFNHEFLNRYLAVAAFLAKGGSAIQIGEGPSTIELDASYLGGVVPLRVDEKYLAEIGLSLGDPPLPSHEPETDSAGDYAEAEDEK